MKRIILTLLLLLTLPYTTYSNPVSKLWDTSWISQQWLKYGFLGSACLSGVLDGLVESHKFNGRYITSKSDYHAYRYAQNATMISTGWFLSANLRSNKLTWKTKIMRTTSLILLRRNCFEWAYKANRWGNCFDYSDKHTCNHKAIVYFKWNGSGFTDAYISGTGTQGVIIDLLCWTLGIWLFK